MIIAYDCLNFVMFCVVPALFGEFYGSILGSLAVRLILFALYCTLKYRNDQNFLSVKNSYRNENLNSEMTQNSFLKKRTFNNALAKRGAFFNMGACRLSFYSA